MFVLLRTGRSERYSPVVWHLRGTNKKEMIKKIERTVSINTPPSKVWEYVTNPILMKKWMGETEMNIEVSTDWIVGNPIIIKGFHHVNFENKGTILQFTPQKIIQYSHLSSISRLADTKQNYSTITFMVTGTERKTLLEIQVENFATESIYKHLNFYWQGTANVLKNLIEQSEVKTSHTK